MKDRLIELLKKSRCDKDCSGFVNSEFCKACTSYERYVKSADYLLENGVIVKPPKELCNKIGDNIFVVADGDITEALLLSVGFDCDGNDEVIAISIEEEGICCRFADVGKTVFLTREEAEQALQKGAKQ